MTHSFDADPEKRMRLAKALGEECEALLEIRRALLGETSWLLGVGDGLLSACGGHDGGKSAYGPETRPPRGT